MTTPRDPDHDPTGAPVVHLTRRAALAAERAALDADRATARRPRPRVPRARPPRPHPVRLEARTAPAPSVRAGRTAVPGALAAFVLFAASAMPAHAAAGTAVATSTIAPTVRTQDFAVTRAVAAAGTARDGFTVGGGGAGVPGTEVTFGGEVRSPFPTSVRLSSGFGHRAAPCGACSSLHQGLDFTPGMGAPIGAVAAGTVRIAGTYASYGTAVVIDHEVDGRRVSTLYGHLIPGSTPLRVGDHVAAGEFIGNVGSSGVSTGAHLHLEVLLDGTRPVDPAVWLESHIGHPL